MKKIVALLLVLFLFVTAGCNGSATSDPDVLSIAIGSEPSSVDIMAETNDVSAIIMLGSVYEQLVTINDKEEIITELAESYTISPDFKDYTYVLRQGVKFHDGTDLKSDAVVASMNRWLDIAATADTLVGGARFEAVDEYTVTIHIPNGSAYLNELIATYANHAIITTVACIEEANLSDSGFLQTYVGTGPYKWDDWVSTSHVTLTGWEDYQPYGTEGDYSGWGGYKTAHYKTVRINFVTDPETLNAGLSTGEYAMSANLPITYHDDYAGKSNFNILTKESEFQAMIFNKKEGWGANAKFRQGVQALLDCDLILKAYLGNESFYELYSSYHFTGSQWYTEAGSEYYNQANQERAKELFAEAGFTENDTFIILCASDRPIYYSFAQVVQNQFTEIGLKCELLTYDWGTFTQIRNDEPGNYNAFLTAFSPKALPNLNLFLSATWAGWCDDARVQNDLASIASSADPAAAMKTWEDLQLYMYEEYVPVVKFGTSLSLTISSNKCQGATFLERLIWVNASPSPVEAE